MYFVWDGGQSITIREISWKIPVSQWHDKQRASANNVSINHLSFQYNPQKEHKLQELHNTKLAQNDRSENNTNGKRAFKQANNQLLRNAQYGTSKQWIESVWAGSVLFKPSARPSRLPGLLQSALRQGQKEKPGGRRSRGTSEPAAEDTHHTRGAEGSDGKLEPVGKHST